MSKINDVISLVQTLTKSEKRYISVIINKMKGKEQKEEPHLELYGSLSRLIKEAEKKEGEEINQFLEDSIKESKAQDQADLYGTLNAIRLNDFLLECLRQYNSDKPAFKLETYLQNIRLLSHKKLYHQALKLIKKAKKEAQTKFENQLKLLELLKLERKVLLRSGNTNFKKIRSLQQDCQQLSIGIGQILETLEDHEKILECVRTGEFNTEIQLSSSSKKLIDHPEFAREMPLEAGIYGLAATSDYLSFKEQKAEAALQQMKEMLQLFERNEARKIYNSENYHRAVTKFINKCYLVEANEEVVPYIEWISSSIVDQPGPQGKALQLKLDSQSADYSFDLLNVLLLFYINQKKYHLLSDLIGQAEEVVLSAGLRISIRIILFFNFSVAFLLLKQHMEARHYIDQVLAFKSSQRKKDIIFLAELLLVILEYETCKTKHQKGELEGKIGHLIIQISKRDQSPEVKVLARLFLNSLHLCLFEENVRVQSENFRQLLNALKEKGVSNLGFAGFRSWVEDKISELK